MKKAVIVLIIILILAIGAVVWLIRPVERPLTPESAVELAAMNCDKDTKELVLLVQALQSGNCGRINDNVLNVYCQAAFGTNKCAELWQERQNSCNAILQRNPAGCEDETCNGILENEQGCESSTCTALARRDIAGITDPTECAEIVQSAERNAECFQKATSPEEMDACINA
ncbi:MAG TPA: hypothetical protein VI612_04225 [Candidatus Nanoarchaeia archaeon]|nr:hypothetical protein [Candidatus Nanoarchaeia archaeon]